MKVSSTLSCCPCSWPYFLTLSYISGRKDRSMDESVKPASLSLNAVGQSLMTSQASPVCVNTPSDAGESLKSPNMSTDSGFEGENNRPLLLTTMSSPSKDGILNSWSSDVFCRGKEALHFDGSDLTSLKSPKKSTDDSDFNESPFDKKSVPGASDAHSESDNEFGSEHNCTFFAAEPSWSETGTPLKEHFCVEGNVGVLTSQISAFSVCLRSHCAPDEKCETKNKKNNVEIGKCPSCHKLNFISTEDPADPARCPSDLKWSGRLASIHEDKDCVIYAENDIGTNSEDDYDLHCKPDTETESSDEKMFDGAYSDETLSAYYVPSAVSVTTEDYQQPSNVIKEKVLVVEMDENSSEDGSGSLCLCHIGMCKSSRCQNERSRYTTILKPKAVRPSANPNRVDYHSSLESLQGQHVIAAIGQHRNRLSAFHERPASSLSQNESMQYFFSRSLDMPPISSSVRQASSPLSMGSAAGFVSSNLHIFSEPHNDLCSLSSSRIGTGRSRKSNCSDSHSSSNLERKGSKCKSSEDKKLSLEGGSAKEAVKSPRVKRFSMPWELFWKNESCRHESMNLSNEPIHMTLEEVHNSLQILSPHSNSESSTSSSKSEPQNVVGKHSSSGLLGSYLRQKKSKKEEKQQSSQQAKTSSSSDSKYQRKSFPVFIKSAFSNLFGLKKHPALDSRFSNSHSEDELSTHTVNHRSSPNTSPFSNRALPPLPISGISEWEALEEEDPWTFDSSQSQLGDKDSEPEDFVRRQMDYAASIEKVKDCGWYWGPISGETAEKLLSGEPDGSFVVRDSSDEHYIFSLTFKLNGLVRHVRIEHDHGNFSFGCLQKFRSNTIVDFIDSAVAHSRSGRYLFFLHRRPILGPMRVQLLHPVSRFKQVQSLQHLCRFIILKTLRRDLIDHLPLPKRLKDYLNTPHYYSEELATLSLLNKKHPENRATCRRSGQPESSSSSSSTTTTRNESAPSSSNPPTSNG